MICPKCGMEYQPGVTECSDCHVPLEAPENLTHQTDGMLVLMHPVKLVSAQSGFEADMIIEMLETLQIPSVRKRPGSGEYMQVLMGFSIYGDEIYVDETDYGRAKEALEILRTQEETDGAEEQRESETEEDGAVSRFRAGHGVRIIFLLMVASFFLFEAVRLVMALGELAGLILPE